MTADMPDIGSHLYVFLLAAFLGLEVIKRVSPLLHTPLMKPLKLLGVRDVALVVLSLKILKSSHHEVVLSWLAMVTQSIPEYGSSGNAKLVMTSAPSIRQSTRRVFQLRSSAT